MTPTDPPPLLAARDLRRSHRSGTVDVHAVRDVSLWVARGEMLAIEGPSGAGKSTLLHLLALLDTPDHGTIQFDGHPVHELPEPERTHLRLHHMGLVTQHPELIPELDAIDNISVPAILARRDRRTARKRSHELLDLVGLAERGTHHPADLSGGEQQRLAIARALANDPTLLIADEPTGSLDTTTGDRTLDLLRQLARRGAAVLIATHDVRASAHADRTLRLVDGQILHRDMRDPDHPSSH